MLTKFADPPAAPVNPLASNPLSPGGSGGGSGGGSLAQQPHADFVRDIQNTLSAPRPATQPLAPTPQPAAPPAAAPPAATPPPAGGGAPPVHGQDGIIVPPPVNHNQNATNALDMFAPPGQPAGGGQPPAGGPPSGQDATLPPPQFSQPPEPFRPLHSQHSAPAQPLPPPRFSDQMSADSNTGLAAHQLATARPPAGLEIYTQRAAERLSQLPPAAAQQTMQGAARSVNDIMAQLGPAGQRQFEQIMRTGQVSPQIQAAGVQQLQSQGFDPQAAMQTYQGMGSFEKLLLWGGMSLGAIGLISALSGQGGVGSFLMTALGLGAAGGVAAHGGLFGQGAQQTMQGLLGTTPPPPAAPGSAPAPGGQPQPSPQGGAGGPPSQDAAPASPSTPAAASPGATPTAQGRIQMLNQTATTRPEMLPGLFTQFAHELSPSDRQDLDRASRAGYFERLVGNVDQRLAEKGFAPEAIPVLLRAWAQWSPANPPRPQQQPQQ